MKIIDWIFNRWIYGTCHHPAGGGLRAFISVVRKRARSGEVEFRVICNETNTTSWHRQHEYHWNKFVPYKK